MPSIRTQLQRLAHRSILVGSLVIMLGLSVWQVRDRQREGKQQLLADLAELAQRTDTRFMQAVQASEAAAALMGSSGRIAPDETLFGFLERAVSAEPIVSSAAVIFDPQWAQANRVDQPFSADRPILFVFRDSTTGEVGRLPLPFENLPPAWEEGWETARATVQPTWTAPYFDDLGAQVDMISFLVPILDRTGTVIGMVNTDLGHTALFRTLDADLHETVRYHPAEETPFILSSGGRFIHHRDHRNLAQSCDEAGFGFDYPGICDQIQQGGEPVGLVSVREGSGFHWLAWEPMRASGHVMVLYRYRSIWSLLPVQGLLIVLLISVAAGALLTPLISRVVFQVTDPLTRLGEAARRIGEGDRVAALPVDRTDELGELARAMETMYQQVEERQQLEKELVREQVAAQERAKFEQLFQAPTDGVIFIQERVIVEANNAMAHLLGYADRSELNGKGILSISAPTQADETPSAQAVETILQRVQAGEVVEDAWLAQRKDGSILPVRITVFLGHYEGRPALLCTLKDVSELQAAIDRANRAADTIARMSREHESFVRHELNNAITPLVGYSDLLMRHIGGDPDALARWADSIHRGAQSMSELLSALRDLQAIERGDKEVRREPVELVGLIGQEIRNQELAAGGKVSVTFRSQFPEMYIPGDPAFLPGVFRNLIKNAIEHVRDLPATEQQLSVTLAEGEGGVAIMVANGGSPVPADRLEHFFEKFNSTKRDRGGTGLGTSYAWTVVQAHKGSISVRSDAEKGTRVRVWLPQSAA